MAPTGFAEAQQPLGYFMEQDTAKVVDAIAVLKTLRKTTTFGDISWQELRDSGRK